MYLRSKPNNEQFVGGKSVLDNGKANLYPTAFPFDRCGGNVAFVALTGANPAVTTLTDLWPQNTVRTLPAAGFTIGISSSNANDTSAGSGARTVEIDALDTNYVPYTITMTLNGQTKVSDTVLGATAFRINDIRIKTWGNTVLNAGDIYVYDASDTVTAGVPQTASKIFHKIVASENVARGGFYTVPAGCQLQTQQYRAGIYEAATASSKAVSLSIGYLNKTSSGLAKSNFPIPGQVSGNSPFVTVSPDFPAILDEKTEIRLEATASASSAVVAVLDCVLFYK